MTRHSLLALALLLTVPGVGLAEQGSPTPASFTIDGSPAFGKAVRAALERLGKTPTGRELLLALGRAPHGTTITQIFEPGGWSRAAAAGANRTATGAGPGSDTTIGWNPDYAPGLPADIVLAHELIHTLHARRGLRDPQILDDPDNPDDGIRQEELRTVGLPGFDQNRITENAIRRDWNQVFGTQIPDRRTYRGPMLTGLPRTPTKTQSPPSRSQRTGGKRGLAGALAGPQKDR